MMSRSQPIYLSGAASTFSPYTSLHMYPLSIMHHVLYEITRLALLCPCAVSQDACDIAHKSNAVWRREERA
jgi:hypothetical protein